MTDAPVAAPLKTPLHGRHVALGAKMVSFGGWEMPLQYSGITEEHLAVRRAAGLFDVSHMGEIEVAGADALAAVQRISTNDAARLEVGQAQYSALATPEGTFVDDLLVYRLGDEHFLLVVNAATIAKDFAWIRDGIQGVGDAVAVNTSSRYALIAVQGPRALEIVQSLTEVDLASIGYYRFATGEVANVRSTISRTGYTGEDGFEIFVAPQVAERLWGALLSVGAPAGVRPAGLGARDTLRLEAAMPLYGHELSEQIDPYTAGLGFAVNPEAAEFIGREAVIAAANRELRQRVGLKLDGRRIAREGAAVVRGDASVGEVTSGTFSPTLEIVIAMAYVTAEVAAPGTAVEVDIRGRRVAAEVVELPFYRRSSK